jgi:hypothetical protein
MPGAMDLVRAVLLLQFMAVGAVEKEWNIIQTPNARAGSEQRLAMVDLVGLQHRTVDERLILPGASEVRLGFPTPNR